MGQLKALLLVVVLVAAALARNVDEPRLKQLSRASKMTRMWRDKSGVGSLNDVRTAGGKTLIEPAVLQCTQEGYFPQPGSCSNFYRCVDWLGTGKFFSTFKFNCPYGTVFDDDLDICNHPGAVKNPPECAGAMGNLPLPEPPGVDAGTSSGGQPGSEGTGTSTNTGDDTEPCESTLAPYPIPVSVTEGTTPEDAAVTTFPTTSGLPVTTYPTTVGSFVTTYLTNAGQPLTTFLTTEGPSVTTYPTTAAGPTVVPDTELNPATETTISFETTMPFFVETTTAGSMWEVDESSIFQCPAPGYYPYEQGCVRFYKCVETEAGTLKGLLYKCPTGFAYSEEKMRCWPEDDLEPCQRMLQVGHQRHDTATPLYPEDLLWFFNNRK